MKNLFFILLASSFFSCRPSANNAYGALIKEGSAINLVDSNHVIIDESKIMYTFTNKHFLPINTDLCTCASTLEDKEKFIMLILNEYSKSYKILSWDVVYDMGNSNILEGLWIYVDSLEHSNIEVESSTPYLNKILKDTIMIEPGGSLCGTLGMSEEEALSFAQKFGYSYKYKTSGDLIVNIQPGECFVKNGWQPYVIRYMVPKKLPIQVGAGIVLNSSN